MIERRLTGRFLSQCQKKGCGWSRVSWNWRARPGSPDQVLPTYMLPTLTCLAISLGRPQRKSNVATSPPLSRTVMALKFNDLFDRVVLDRQVHRHNEFQG